MKKDLFYRFSSICSACSGIFLIIGWTLDINRDSLLGASFALSGYVLAIFAFIGIGAIQYHKFKIMGFVGFVLTIIANALFIPWVFLDIARVSGVAPQVDWWYVERNGPTGIIAIIGGASFVFGFLLFAVDTIRAKILKRWPAYLLILAAIQPLIHPFTGFSKMLARIAGIALIGFAWNLWAMTKGNNESSEDI